jgi:branched-chain amino acid transport system permease protein
MTFIKSRGSQILIQVSRARPAWFGVLGLLVITLLFSTTQSSYSVYVLDTILLACFGAIALQVLQGTSGLISIGTAAFLLIGGFGSVFVLRAGAPFPIDIICAVGFAGLAGLIGGLPAVRLRALLLALATLAIHYVAIFLGDLYENHVPGAANGGFFLPTLFGSQGLSDSARYWAWMLAVLLGLLVLGTSRIMKERSGRALRMIREHEHIAPMLGIPVTKYKLLIFMLSSMVIGLEGALLVHFTGSVSTDTFPLTLAFQYVAMIIIGGLDSLAGAVIGAVIVVGLPIWVPDIVGSVVGTSEATANGSNIALIIYGILVVVFVTASPGGVVGLLKSLKEKRWSRPLFERVDQMIQRVDNAPRVER